MNVSSYLEAFLSVYGWAVYRTMFLLFMMTGLFLYPILRSLIGLLIDFLSSGRNDATGYLKQAGVVVALSIAVFFFAMVPIVDMSFSKARMHNTCGVDRNTAAAVNEGNKTGQGNKYFSITETRVPILPWIAMRLGQGVNGIFYTSLPCVMHISDANRAAMNVQTGDASLDQEFDEFMNQCHYKAVRIIKDIQAGVYDNGRENGAAQQWLNEELVKEANAKYRQGGWQGWKPDYSTVKQIKPNEMNELTEFVDSEFIYKYFYSISDSPINNAPPAVREALGSIPMTMRANRAVQALPGVNGDHLPTCAAWWKKGDGQQKSLRQRLLSELTYDATVRAAGTAAGIGDCQFKTGAISPTGNFLNPKSELENEAGCKAKLEEALTKKESRVKGSKEELMGRQVLLNYQGNRAHIKDMPTSGEDQGKTFLLSLGALAVGVIQSVTGVDLSGGMIGTVVSFYLSVFLVKLMLKFLLPMVIMTVYMFWGVYMLIGELRGSTLVKGMVAIFSLTIIPGLWAIADHLDDKLWDAMYDSWIDSPIQMILLDAASGIFYLGIMMVVFYLTNLAGAGDAGNTLAGVQSRAGGLSDKVGAAGTTGAGKGWKWFTRGHKNKQGEIVSGGYWSKFKAGAKNGWDKMWSK